MLSVDEFQSIEEIRAGDGGGGDGLEDLRFFFFEIERFGFGSLAISVGFLFRRS